LEIVMFRILVALLVCLLPAIAIGQVPFPQPAQASSFSFEDKDWGVEATTTTKTPPYHAPTPTSIPGARVIKTLELNALLETNKNVVVIDVLSSKTRKTIPGAFWMPDGGDGPFFAAESSKFSTALDKLTGGDKTRPLVFLCISSECWLSYNASLHALEVGYKDVIWYRGGTNSWEEANLERKKPARISHGHELTLSKGESADLGSVYWLDGSCQSRLKEFAGVDLLEGPSGIELTIRKESVMAKKQNCPDKIPGGIVVLTAQDIPAAFSGTIKYRVRYKTEDGDKQSLHAKEISLTPN
jgi:PQQ-dependent catabolism-associated CXXCW motif protein